MRKFSNLGFTLIELLVVISIIGILATLLTANLNSARSRARDAQRKSDIRNIATSLRLYFNDWNMYPPNCSSTGICGCTSASGPPITLCTWGTQWKAGTVIYMSKIPSDPLSAQSYFYKVGALGANDTYVLSACLENTSDTSGVTGVAGVNMPSPCPSGKVFVVNQQ